ncbi:MAG TPA: outer membrane lipoprotein-sorting protein [Pyrinomonadaceae bacterium]|jgi:outer membrane lipoprotein-sorting protein
MRYALLLLCALALLAPTAQAKKIKTAEELIAAMQKKYAKSWYRTATFVQKTTEIDKDGKSTAAIWYEALAMPGKLRIDFDPIKDGNGILFADDTLYSFKAGKLERTQPLVHPLLVLGFDVYFLPPEQTIAKLKQLKFDFSVLREDTWQGRPVYVVGAKMGDLRSPQFWIDRERLYFVRMIRPVGKDGSLVSETQFNKYQKLGGGWIAPEVIFMINGKTTTTEEYSDMRAGVALDQSFFDPQHWSTASHWRK